MIVKNRVSVAQTAAECKPATYTSTVTDPSPPPAQNVLNFMCFLEHLAKSYVGVRRRPRVGAPSYWQSWTRPCSNAEVLLNLTVLTRFSIRTTSNMPMLLAVQVIVTASPCLALILSMSHVASAALKDTEMYNIKMFFLDSNGEWLL